MSRRDNRAHLTVPVGPDDHSIGREDAPLTLVEYGDFQCPHCGRAYPTVKELQRRLGAQLRFVFREFPLTMIHPEAEHAAEAAEAAAVQRALFVLDDQGMIRWRYVSDPAVNPGAEGILTALEELKQPGGVHEPA